VEKKDQTKIKVSREVKENKAKNVLFSMETTTVSSLNKKLHERKYSPK
jgi:hypothetical protein